MHQSKPVATVGETAASIEQRLRAHPELLPDVVALLDIVELKRAGTATADQAERGVRTTLQQLGQKTLGAWATQRQAQVVAQSQAADAAVQRHAQKNSSGTPPTAPSQ
jgi:predicted negative regulator of RcsB-dependent stress response